MHNGCSKANEECPPSRAHGYEAATRPCWQSQVPNHLAQCFCCCLGPLLAQQSCARTVGHTPRPLPLSPAPGQTVDTPHTSAHSQLPSALLTRPVTAQAQQTMQKEVVQQCLMQGRPADLCKARSANWQKHSLYSYSDCTKQRTVALTKGRDTASIEPTVYR